VSLFFLYYNYCRPHQTLTKAASGTKTTPAMASGLTERVWTVKDIVALMDPRQLGLVRGSKPSPDAVVLPRLPPLHTLPVRECDPCAGHGLCPRHPRTIDIPGFLEHSRAYRVDAPIMVQFDRRATNEGIDGCVHGGESRTAGVGIMAQTATRQRDRTAIIEGMLPKARHIDLTHQFVEQPDLELVSRHVTERPPMYGARGDDDGVHLPDRLEQLADAVLVRRIHLEFPVGFACCDDLVSRGKLLGDKRSQSARSANQKDFHKLSNA
jgi:hypothetical protein